MSDHDPVYTPITHARVVRYVATPRRRGPDISPELLAAAAAAMRDRSDRLASEAFYGADSPGEPLRVFRDDDAKQFVYSMPLPSPALRFRIVASWLSHYEWRDFGPPLRPPPHGERKGTRRQWKRRTNRLRGWRRVWKHVEPEHVLRLPDGLVLCTAAQYSALKARLGYAP